MIKRAPTLIEWNGTPPPPAPHRRAATLVRVSRRLHFIAHDGDGFEAGMSFVCRDVRWVDHKGVRHGLNESTRRRALRDFEEAGWRVHGFAAGPDGTTPLWPGTEPNRRWRLIATATVCAVLAAATIVTRRSPPERPATPPQIDPWVHAAQRMLAARPGPVRLTRLEYAAASRTLRIEAFAAEPDAALQWRRALGSSVSEERWARAESGSARLHLSLRTGSTPAKTVIEQGASETAIPAIARQAGLASLDGVERDERMIGLRGAGAPAAVAAFLCGVQTEARTGFCESLSLEMTRENLRFSARFQKRGTVAAAQPLQLAEAFFAPPPARALPRIRRPAVSATSMPAAPTAEKAARRLENEWAVLGFLVRGGAPAAFIGPRSGGAPRVVTSGDRLDGMRVDAVEPSSGLVRLLAEDGGVVTLRAGGAQP